MIDRDTRLARVRCVVAAGRRIADAADPLGREARARLPDASGLSPEGVELALSDHLETSPLPEHLDALVASAGAAPACHVVIAANVCTAALRAIAVATATAPRVLVKPSRRDPVVAELLLRALSTDADFAANQGSIEQVAEIDAAPGDELHVYGSDDTVAALTATARAGVVVRGHGAGMGVAIVGSEIGLENAAAAIARDVVPFDQRGCLSPRVVLVEGSAARASQLAEALHAALSTLGERVPRGPLDQAAQGEITLHRASMQATGTWWEGPHHGVGLDPEPRALALPPASRIVHVVSVWATSADALLAPLARYVTTIGSDDDGPLTRGAAALAPRARRARLGAMQRPPLDGPVDLRAISRR